MQLHSQNFSPLILPPPGHFLPTRRTFFTILAFLASVALLSTLSWFASAHVAKEHEARLFERERIMANTTAETISANVGRNLAQLHSIPMVLANEPSLIATLSRFGPDVQPSELPLEARQKIWQADPEFAALARRLKGLIERADVSQVWVTNAAADCFVSAGFPEDKTATGVNYAKRHYFRAAQRGQNGSQFAVGATTIIPGLFFSSPVQANGQFLGVVVVKLELQKLAPLVAAANTFITDEHGVIILSQDPDLLMKTMPDASVEQLPDDVLDNRYRRKTFESISMPPASGAKSADLVQWQGSGRPYILAKKHIPGEVVNIHVLRSLGELEQIRREHLGLFLLLSLTGFLLTSVVVGMVIYLRRSREVRDELTLLANTDVLTGCANRRNFLAALNLEWQRAVRYGCPFSVIYLDLDYFKQINDQFGHFGGDQVLCHFVNIVEKALRPSDKLGRVGGEEFVILLTQTPVAGAVAVAERILADIKESPAQIGRQQCTYTFSAGTAEWRPGEESSDNILHRADQSLYQAKCAGRNRVQGEV